MSDYWWHAGLRNFTPKSLKVKFRTKTKTKRTFNSYQTLTCNNVVIFNVTEALKLLSKEKKIPFFQMQIFSDGFLIKYL